MGCLTYFRNGAEFGTPGVVYSDVPENVMQVLEKWKSEIVQKRGEPDEVVWYRPKTPELEAWLFDIRSRVYVQLWYDDGIKNTGPVDP